MAQANRVLLSAGPAPDARLDHAKQGGLSIETALSLYRTMLRIRRFELTAQKVYRASEMPGFIHLYIGEEAIAAGVCASAFQ